MPVIGTYSQEQVYRYLSRQLKLDSVYRYRRIFPNVEILEVFVAVVDTDDVSVEPKS